MPDFRVQDFSVSAFLLLKLAVVTSHPIQYNAPWFRRLAGPQDCKTTGLQDQESSESRGRVVAWSRGLSVRVFYLWDGADQLDPGFGRSVKWDIPLLDGYDHEFVPNRAKHPGPGSIRGLDNPELISRIEAFQPDAILLFGYNYLAHYRLIFSRLARRVPLLFRGDSHLLGRDYKTTQPHDHKTAGGQSGNTEGIPSLPLEERARERRPVALSRSPVVLWSAPLRRLWISAVFRRFSAFLYVGQANRDYFRYHGVPDEKLFFAPHAVDNERFMREAQSAKRNAGSDVRSTPCALRLSLGIPDSHRVILFAGKFEPKKRPDDLIAAFQQARLENTTLLMVGNGPLEAEIRAAADTETPKHRNTETPIVFAPFQNQSQMPRIYAAADLFVLPSFGPGETWGLAVNEAMCLGLPIIVSDHVGCARDLVRSGENGLLFPAGDVPALASALRHALGDPARLRRWGVRSREIIQDYSYAQTTAGLFAALSRVVPEGRPRIAQRFSVGSPAEKC